MGDASHGWLDHGPYDVIVLTGSTPVLPEEFKESLMIGGRLFVVEGEAPVMSAALITCVEKNTYSKVGLFETCIPALRNAQKIKQFVF